MRKSLFGIFYAPQLAKRFLYNAPPPPFPFPLIRQYFYGFRASVLLRAASDVGFYFIEHFYKPVTKSKLYSLKKRVYNIQVSRCPLVPALQVSTLQF